MYNEELLKKLSEGSIVLEYDQSVDADVLNKVLLKAFPKDKDNDITDYIEYNYFCRSKMSKNEWMFFIDDDDLSLYHSEDSYIVNIREFIITEQVDEC